MSIKEIINGVLGRATPFKRNGLGDIDVLIHKDARRHTPHGLIVASNKALKIKRQAVAIAFPDLEDTSPELTYQVMTDLWEAMHAQGWVAHHVAAWGSVRELVATDRPTTNAIDPVEGFQSTGFGERPAIDLDDVPAYLRRDYAAEAAAGTNAASGVLTFPRRDAGKPTDTAITDPTVLRLVAMAMKRVEHLDEMTRNASKIRLEQIGANGLATAKSYEFISDKLTAATSMILSAHREHEAVEAQSN